MPHYVDTVTVDGDRVARPTHEDDHSADPENYHYHYRNPEGGVPTEVVVAANNPIGTYEDLVDDPDSDVYELTDADRAEEVEVEGLDETQTQYKYPTPDDRADDDTAVHDAHAK